MLENYKSETVGSKFIILLFCLLPVSLIVGTGVSESIVIFISSIFLINFILERNINSKIVTLLYVLIFLWIILIINYFFSIDRSNSLLRNVFFIKYIIFVIGSLDFLLKRSNALKIILFVWSIILLIFAVDLLYQFIFKQNIFGIETKYKNIRVSGFMGDEFKAGTLMMGLGLSSILFFLGNSKKNFFLICLIFFLIFVVFLTNERSTFIKLISILIPFILFIKKENILKYLILFLILISTITILTIERESSFKRRYVHQIFVELKNNNFNIFNYIEKTEYGVHRTDAIKLFKYYPITGVGNKNFRILCKKNEYEFLNKKDFENSICTTHPHQFYYEILSEHGLFGLISFLILFFIFIIDFYNNFKIHKSLYNLFLFLLILSFFFPILPSGSFFTSFNATIFWINFILYFYSRINPPKIQ